VGAVDEVRVAQRVAGDLVADKRPPDAVDHDGLGVSGGPDRLHQLLLAALPVRPVAAVGEVAGDTVRLVIGLDPDQRIPGVPSGEHGDKVHHRGRKARFPLADLHHHPPLGHPRHHLVELAQVLDRPQGSCGVVDVRDRDPNEVHALALEVVEIPLGILIVGQPIPVDVAAGESAKHRVRALDNERGSRGIDDPIALNLVAVGRGGDGHRQGGRQQEER